MTSVRRAGLGFALLVFALLRFAFVFGSACAGEAVAPKSTSSRPISSPAPSGIPNTSPNATRTPLGATSGRRAARRSAAGVGRVSAGRGCGFVFGLALFGAIEERGGAVVGQVVVEKGGEKGGAGKEERPGWEERVEVGMKAERGLAEGNAGEETERGVPAGRGAGPRGSRGVKVEVEVEVEVHIEVEVEGAPNGAYAYVPALTDGRLLMIFPVPLGRRLSSTSTAGVVPSDAGEVAAGNKGEDKDGTSPSGDDSESGDKG
ncbi:hypothetical protein C8R47DRAFT_1099595 [Mycena vitilis]|nr:hypothetical protein C8R47DRAFT_1099595 [Mycena vitilis]